MHVDSLTNLISFACMAVVEIKQNCTRSSHGCSHCSVIEMDI